MGNKGREEKLGKNNKMEIGVKKEGNYTNLFTCFI